MRSSWRAARTSTGLVFPSPRSDSVWNSDNFRADVFAKALKRAAAKTKPAQRADFERLRLQFHDLYWLPLRGRRETEAMRNRTAAGSGPLG